MLLFTFYVVYIVIVCCVFLALRDVGGRRFISTVFSLLLLKAHLKLFSIRVKELSEPIVL